MGSRLFLASDAGAVRGKPLEVLDLLALGFDRRLEDGHPLGLQLGDRPLRVGQRFTPSELGLDRGDERVCIEVRDEGPGCPGSQLETLFEPFVRGGSELTRRAQGTGIGLALVRDLVGRMRGQVQARNRDPGLELRVSLPTA